ncbi:MAG: AAA family ATPase [Candidatus Parabeggiatoa sp. nov. 1]|nr:MAG: AAA family ATPase [Gammaproteobacteria bacterium]
MDLFEHVREPKIDKESPLAARMRPRTLDEFIGQEHIMGQGSLLRRAIQADQLSSLIFYGPPGTGKTTLARIIANTTHAHFLALNAVLSGVKDIREAIASAKEKRGLFGQKTILFIDEVHRFNKAQQDALLPHVENGVVILIGATTENPYFEVNKALVSRSRIFQLRSLTEADLRAIAWQALADKERGFGQLKVNLCAEALDHLVNVANGDARAVLNALELAIETTLPDASGLINLTIAVAEESIQRRAVLYDKDGDAHFDTISAFIKSLRGSDPDAALYWLAKMVYAGEDPRFIFRRMLIFAGEDIGLADPNALPVVTAAAQAFDYVGLPEGRYHLAEACLYLATAPKSNSVLAFFDALHTVEQEREAEVPSHLRDSSRDAKDFGHGAGYLYPHSYRNHWVAQQYLPASLQGRAFYQPTRQGYEAAIHQQVARQREEQLAAMLEPAAGLDWTGEKTGAGPPAQSRWLQRTLSNVGQQLGQIRDQVLALAQVERHDLVLDLNAGLGLLTWEATRRALAGGVWALAANERTAQALIQQAENLDKLERPVILNGAVTDLPLLIKKALPAPAAALHYDVIIGRNVFTQLKDKRTAAQTIHSLLKPNGRLVLAEIVPQHTQRLHQLVDLSGLPAEQAQRMMAAEETIYTNSQDAMVNWDVADLQQIFQAAGFSQIDVKTEVMTSNQYIGAEQIERWFALETSGRQQRATFAQLMLKGGINPPELAKLSALFEQQLLNQAVSWQSTMAYLIFNTR